MSVVENDRMVMIQYGSNIARVYNSDEDTGILSTGEITMMAIF